MSETINRLWFGHHFPTYSQAAFDSDRLFNRHYVS